jgi:hypothetical protein
VDLISALAARYCVRQNAHAFIWLWALFLGLAGAALVLRRRGARFESAVLFLFALCTGAVGLAVFYGCYRWAPYSMGLTAPGTSAVNLNNFMCLTHDAASITAMWTVIALLCCATAGLLAWARPGRSAAARGCCYVAAVFALLVVLIAAVVVFFNFSWCTSERLF